MLKKLSAFLQSINTKPNSDVHQIQVGDITVDVVKKNEDKPY